MSTKLVGDISEHMVQLELLKNGYGVLVPIGDRLPYDLVAEKDNRFARIQVKTAYLNGGYWIGNARRARTNRSEYSFVPVDTDNTDFFVYVIQPQNLFLVFPSSYVSKYKGNISVSGKKHIPYRNNWDILFSE